MSKPKNEEKKDPPNLPVRVKEKTGLEVFSLSSDFARSVYNLSAHTSAKPEVLAHTYKNNPEQLILLSDEYNELVKKQSDRWDYGYAFGLAIAGLITTSTAGLGFVVGGSLVAAYRIFRNHQHEKKKDEIITHIHKTVSALSSKERRAARALPPQKSP